MSLSDVKENARNLEFGELKELRSFIDKTIEDREKKARADLIDQMDALAKEKGFGSLDAVLKSTGDGKKVRKPAPPKYRNPNDADQTWTGRGRKPQWVQEILDRGGNLDDLAIKDAR